MNTIKGFRLALSVIRTIFRLCFLLAVFTAHAQLAVSVLPVKITGQKAIVPLAMTNNLTVGIESVRAVCFLLDEQGKLVGQSTKWIIGGSKDRQVLQPKSGTAFNFVITSPQSFTATNLTAKVSISRLTLAGGKQVDIKHDVVVTNSN